ncbi:hypothetical protein [Methylorubrum extorquens]
MVPARIGNLYDPDFDAALTPRPCPLAQCRCHIGLRERFGAGLPEQALPPSFDAAAGTPGLVGGRTRIETHSA